MGISLEDLHNSQALHKNITIRNLKLSIREAELKLISDYPHNPNESTTTLAEIEEIYKEIKRAKSKLLLMGVKT